MPVSLCHGKAHILFTALYDYLLVELLDNLFRFFLNFYFLRQNCVAVATVSFRISESVLQFSAVSSQMRWIGRSNINKEFRSN